MKLKLDENLGERGRRAFVEAGHDVATVAEEGLAGAIDRQVIAACQAEGRCLVTLDLDFSNPFVLPPRQFHGIAVLRLPRRLSPKDIDAAVSTLITRLASASIEGKLWIVERGRVREYSPEDEGSSAE